jgi:hypothetical protein
MKRETTGAAASSIKPGRPWSLGRRGASCDIEWMRDGRGRIRTFSDEAKALAALRDHPD